MCQNTKITDSINPAKNLLNLMDGGFSKKILF